MCDEMYIDDCVILRMCDWRARYLEQEPKLDKSKNVTENIMDGLKEQTDLLKRFEEISVPYLV